jgi:hypothetical protein
MSKSLFQKAKPEAAYLKAGLYGDTGSGKTFTASLIAIGLHKMCKAKKPVFFIDSETGSDYVLPLFEKNKVELQVAKTRAFKDLNEAIDEAEKDGFLLLIDSLTHFWDDLMESFKRKKNLSRLTIRHWSELKPIWREFSAKYVSYSVHIVACGRAGDVWEDVEDEEGVKELRKTGTKMRTEKETAYEPSLLIEMSKVIEKHGYKHRAFIEKDRFDQMTFKSFLEPKFEDFLPHIQCLNLGGKHHVLDRERNSEELFQAGSNSGYNRMKKKDVILDELSEMIKYYYPGQDKDSKKARIDIIRKYFDGYGWEKVTQIQDVDLLEAQYKKIKSDLQKQFPDKAEEKPEKENKKKEIENATS